MTYPGGRSACDLKAMDSLDDGQAWAVGGGDRAYFFDGTGWADRSWKPPFGDPGTLYGVSALGASQVLAVGDGASGVRGADIIYYDGDGWTPQDSGFSNTSTGIGSRTPTTFGGRRWRRGGEVRRHR